MPWEDVIVAICLFYIYFKPLYVQIVSTSALYLKFSALFYTFLIGYNQYLRRILNFKNFGMFIAELLVILYR